MENIDFERIWEIVKMVGIGLLLLGVLAIYIYQLALGKNSELFSDDIKYPWEKAEKRAAKKAAKAERNRKWYESK